MKFERFVEAVELFIRLCKVVQTFKAVDEIMLNELNENEFLQRAFFFIPFCVRWSLFVNSMDGILISAIQIQVGVFYFRVLQFSILKVEGFDFGA